nr:MAG TPA: hypothetical protein [Caudoviricetes sp.]
MLCKNVAFLQNSILLHFIIRIKIKNVNFYDNLWFAAKYIFKLYNNGL